MYEKVALKLIPANSEKLSIDPSTIPTIAPSQSINDFQKGDTTPYYKVQKINFPVLANGMNYQKSFFESLLSNMKDRPIPGSKDGHNMQWGARSKTDFLLVGGKIENGKDDTGSVYLKNYVPPKAESDNQNFITECKSDLVHFSIVAYARKEIIENSDGTYTVNVLDCGAQGLRNDAVSYGEGAMGQVTNADNVRVLGKSVSNARKLINAGKINKGPLSANDETPEGDWAQFALWNMIEITDAEAETKGRYKYPYGKNGEVYLQALRAIASRAEQQGLSELSDLARELYDLAKKKTSNKGGNVEKNEILEALKTVKLTAAEVLEAMGESTKLVNKQHEDALIVVNGLAALGIKDPVAEVTAMKATIEQNAKIVRNAALDSAYGSDPEGKNSLRQYAEKMISAEEKNLNAAIEKLKTDPIALKLAGDKADFLSDENAIGKSESTKTDPNVPKTFVL